PSRGRVVGGRLPAHERRDGATALVVRGEAQRARRPPLAQDVRGPRAVVVLRDGDGAAPARRGHRFLAPAALTAITGQCASSRIRWLLLPSRSLPTGVR